MLPAILLIPAIIASAAAQVTLHPTTICKGPGCVESACPFGPAKMTSDVFFIIIVFTLSIVRIVITEVSITRSTAMAIPISLKPLAILMYQILARREGHFRRWASRMLTIVLNVTEVLFWAVLMGLLFQPNSIVCNEASCAVSWVIAFLCLVLLVLGIQAAAVSVLGWGHFRRCHHPGRSVMTPKRDYENAHRMEYGSPALP